MTDSKKIDDGGPANVDEIFARLTNPAKHYREKAAYWERVAAKCRADGDLWHEADAKAKAAGARQRAREIEAEALS